MTDRLGLRSVITAVAVVFAWCALWRDLSVANVFSGLVIAVLLMVSGLLRPNPEPLRVIPITRFMLLVGIDLVKSTWSVAYEVLTPTDYTEEGVIAVQVPAGTCESFLLMTVAITVTPGTAVVDVDAENEILYLHLLHCDRRAEVESHVHELAMLALAARGAGTTDGEVAS